MMKADSNATAYTAYIASKEQNNNKHFKNDNDAPRTTGNMRCNNQAVNALSIIHTTKEDANTLPTSAENENTDNDAERNNGANDGQHHHSNTDADNNNTDNNDTALDRSAHDNCTDDANEAYEHGYNDGFDTGAAYATAYSDRHADGQDTIIVLDGKPDRDWGSNNGSYDNNYW